MFLLYILFGAYLLAVNVYAFMLVKNQKKIYYAFLFFSGLICHSYIFLTLFMHNT